MQRQRITIGELPQCQPLALLSQPLRVHQAIRYHCSHHRVHRSLPPEPDTGHLRNSRQPFVDSRFATMDG
jgi:hypothetical protein